MALDRHETALGVFLDIEGSFNNTSYNSICAGLFKHGVDYTIVRWITAILEGRMTVATLSGSSKNIAARRGYYREVFCHHSYGALLMI